MSQPQIYPWSVDEIVQKMLSSAPSIKSRLQIEKEENTGKLIIKDELSSALINITAHLIRTSADRLNGVSLKTLLQFLSYADQILHLPSPALVPIKFDIRDKYTLANEIPERFQVATLPDSNGDIKVFETLDKLSTQPVALKSAWYADYYRDCYTDLSGYVENNEISPVILFNGYKPACHSIFVTHPIFASFNDKTDYSLLLRMTFRNPQTVTDSSDKSFAGIPGTLSEEERNAFLENFDISLYYYTENDKRYDYPDLKIYPFNHISKIPSSYDRYAVYLFPDRIEKPIKTLSLRMYSEDKKTFVDKSGKYLIFEIKPKNPQQYHKGKDIIPHLETIEFRFNRIPIYLENWNCTVNPIPWKYFDTNNLDYAFYNSQPIDLSKPFKPFGDEPAFNDTFYFSSQFFSRRGHSCYIYTWLMGQLFDPCPFKDEQDPELSPDIDYPVKLSWEYYDGNEWKVLFYSHNNSGIIKDQTNDCLDNSCAFHYSSRPMNEIYNKRNKNLRPPIKIKIPDNIQQITVNGMQHWWLRVRIVSGGYAKVLETKKVEITDQRGAKNTSIEYSLAYVPPMFRTFTIDFCGSDNKYPTFYLFDDFTTLSAIQKMIETTEPEWENTVEDVSDKIQRIIDDRGMFRFDDFYHRDIVDNFSQIEEYDAPVEGGILSCLGQQLREYIIGSKGCTGDFTIETGFKVFNYVGGVCFKYDDSNYARIFIDRFQYCCFQVIYQNIIVVSRIISKGKLPFGSYYSVCVSRDDNTFSVKGSYLRKPDWASEENYRVNLDRIHLDFPRGAFTYTCFVEDLIEMIPPVADAGKDKIVYDLGRDGFCTVAISGSGSYSAPGTYITNYYWTLNGEPISNKEKFNYTLPVGTHRIQLKVQDSNQLDSYDTIIIQVREISIPVADAGEDLEVEVGSDKSGWATLDGSKSYSPNGSINKWEWFSNGQLIDSGIIVSRKFNLGSHSLQLKVTDNYNQFAFVSFNVIIKNQSIPFAHAGKPQIVFTDNPKEMTTIHLDGSESISSENAPIISWSWYENGNFLDYGSDTYVELPVGVHLIELRIENSLNVIAKDTVLIIVKPKVIEGKVKQALYFNGSNTILNFYSPFCIYGDVYLCPQTCINGREYQSVIGGNAAVAKSDKWCEISQKLSVSGSTYIGSGLKITDGSLNCQCVSGFEKDVQLESKNALYLGGDGYFNNKVLKNKLNNNSDNQKVYHSGKMSSNMVENPEMLVSLGYLIDIPSKLTLNDTFQQCDIEVNETMLINISFKLSELIKQKKINSSFGSSDLDRLYREFAGDNKLWNGFLVINIDLKATVIKDTMIFSKKVIFMVNDKFEVKGNMYTSSNESITMIYVSEKGELANMGGKGLFRGYIHVIGSASYKWENSGWIEGAIHHKTEKNTTFTSTSVDQLRASILGISLDQNLFEDLNKADKNGNRVLTFTK